MLPISTTISNQIRFLLNGVTDSTFDSISRQLFQFAEHGSEGSTLVLQTCLSESSSNGADAKTEHLIREIVSLIFKFLLNKPNFCTVFCEAIKDQSLNDVFLEDLANKLNLSVGEKIGLGLALLESENIAIRTKAHNFCIAEINDLSASTNIRSNQIEDIILFIYQSDGLSKHMDTLKRILSIAPQDESFCIATNLILTDDISSINYSRQVDFFNKSLDNDFEAILAETEQEISMSDILRELGYGCTFNIAHCKEILSLFTPLNEVTVSKLIATIVRSPVGLDDSQNVHSSFCSVLDKTLPTDSSLPNSWNVDVLVNSIKQMAPKLNWTRVMENLDHEGFIVPDETTFSLLISIYNKSCQAPFPLHAVCGSVWKNTEGQLSFLRHAVVAPPEIFSFSHCSRPLNYADAGHMSNGNGNQAWSCLDLLNVLCQLAETGYARSVRLILEHPINLCPDILLLGIAHVNTAYNLLKHEVLSAVFPKILNDQMKSSVVHQLWQKDANLVLQGFTEVYTDPSNILRIADVCQELKILPAVLYSTPLPVSLRLAACAYSNEHLHLEKWLNESFNMYKDVFFEHCLAFLQETFSHAANVVPNSSLKKSHDAVLLVYQLACPIVFQVLQANSAQVRSQKLLDELKMLQTMSTTKIQSSSVTEPTNSDGNTDDIEAEANAYFHQMFSGQLTIDAMVQMLARYKESPEKRDQLIFECMIANLFEEYKFFPKYPDKQLKLAAVLFGSLIKHQLVTHLALGIALRGVLDSLRKSTDSKMFMFGTKALEQFIDRLVEWPQYCNHILQISHLRATHTELVSIIERALARISSSQTEVTGGNSVPVELQRGSSTQDSVENVEASDASWQFVSSSSTQLGQLSPFQQKHQGFLGDRIKQNASSVNISKTLLSHASLSSSVPTPVDSVPIPPIPKPTAQSLQAPTSQQSANMPTAVSSSPGFLRSSRSLTPAGMLRQPSYGTGFGAALNIETLVAAAERRDTPIEAPAQDVQDKILFMINNISSANVESKAKEFTEVLNEQYYPWFAQYMVMKRASIEPNFHDLYLKFLEKVNSKALNMEIIKATYENCKALLRSDLIKSSSEERSLLKNVGSWLGKFTIGRNQMLLAREIDPKTLIIEAYERGKMIAVIPFTSKVLEPCHISIAYRPPNPWTMGILGLLTEIYNLPNLKMNLKFDIEVLFKHLHVDMKDVKPSCLLKDIIREVEGNPDFSTKDIIVPQPPVIAEVNSSTVSALNQAELKHEANNTGHPNSKAQYTAPLHPVPTPIIEEEKGGPLVIPERVPSAQGLTQVAASQAPFAQDQLLPIIPNPDSYIKINTKLMSLGPQVHRIMQMAMDKAVTEIVSPVIQRSVTIASRTTKELVLKDYAMESDETAVSRAAHLMAATLAGSLAHVTCKEPLRVALSNHLRILLQTLNVNSDYMDYIVQILINDNLDLGCAVIENVASEKAVELIDGEIGPSFAALRKQREATGSPYFDSATYSQGPFARVPEALRPKPGRLSAGQLRVYNDFITNIWQNQSSQSPTVVPSTYGLSSDSMQEEADHTSAQLRASDSAEISSTVSSFPPNATAPELHVVDPSAVNKDLGNVVPRPKTPSSEHMITNLPEPLLTTGDVLDKYHSAVQKLEILVAKDGRDAEIQGVISEVPALILKCVNRDEAGLAIAQKIFKSFYENSSNSVLVSTYLRMLASICELSKFLVKELTNWLIFSEEEQKFNIDVAVGLIRFELLNLADYSAHLVKLIDGGRNKAATEFSISLVQTLVIHGVSLSDMYNVIDALGKLASRPGSPESLQQLVEAARNNTTNASSLAKLLVNKDDKLPIRDRPQVVSSGPLSNREDYAVAESAPTDPAGFREQVTLLFSEWCRICEVPATSDTAYNHHISQFHQNGLLKCDDNTDRFLRIITELSVAHCLASEQTGTPVSLTLQSTQQFQHLSYTAIDAYSKLVVSVLKYLSVDQVSSKVSLLTKALLVVVRVIQKDAQERKSSFNPRPYFRLFINWIIDLTSDPALDPLNLPILTLLANAFHALQPLKVPGFSFAWLELVSHKNYMPKLLNTNQPKGWPYFQRLLVDLFKFIEPYLRNAELGKPVYFLYKGTLRVLLVLLHDFPEFLCEYHFSFCDVIPPSCIQMRNVILSAFPRNMRLPDPSTPNLKIDLLPEIKEPPRIQSDVDSALKGKQLKTDIDEFLKTKTENSSFLTELKQKLLLPQNEANQAGTRYNVPLINSLVLYVGMQAIQQIQSKSPAQQQMINSSPMDNFLVGAAMDIFQSLVKNLDSEGRYLFFNAVANQLRYPNNHTHYFSFVLLYLFVESKQNEIIQEQITRVLLERLIVNRPHPWGLLITFIELIKNPRYSFWSKAFTRCAPEIEKLFESVSRTCGGTKAADDGMVSGIPDVNH